MAEKRIYKTSTPYRPESTAPANSRKILGDIEVRNSRGRVLWHGLHEYQLDRWRADNPLKKSWTVRLRIFNEGWVILYRRWDGLEYTRRREIELQPVDQDAMNRTLARIAARVFG